MVFYGTSKRDSLLAANFILAAHKSGLKVKAAHKVPKDGSRMIFDILTTPTEYDDYRNAIQFTLAKDSLGSIFVASDDALIYAKVLSSVETRRDQIIVLGSERWLSQSTIDLEKFNTLPVILTAPNFPNPQRPACLAFERKFVKTHGRVPSDYATSGYELMLILGNQLKKNGVYFQGALAKATVPGYLTEGVDYRQGRSNSLIPFIRFTEGEMVVVEKR